MFKLLAFLLILCILFGVEATRAFIFGSVSIVVLVVLGILGLCLLIYALNALGGGKEPEQKKNVPKKENIDKRANIAAFIIMALFGVAFTVAIFFATK